MVTEADMNKCMKLNLYSAIEAIKGFQESLKKNNYSKKNNRNHKL